MSCNEIAYILSLVCVFFQCFSSFVFSRQLDDWLSALTHSRFLGAVRLLLGFVICLATHLLVTVHAHVIRETLSR